MSGAKRAEKLEQLARDGLKRSLHTRQAVGGKFTVDGAEILNFSSNDYLNFAGDERVKSASRDAIERRGAGATGSRLMAGTLDLHQQLERALADLVGAPAALVFGSGFLANLGVLTSLASRGDEIFADRLNHASLVDGARLSRAKVRRYHHNDMEHLESLLASSTGASRRVIVTESLFSPTYLARRLWESKTVCASPATTNLSGQRESSKGIQARRTSTT